MHRASFLLSPVFYSSSVTLLSWYKYFSSKLYLHNPVVVKILTNNTIFFRPIFNAATKVLLCKTCCYGFSSFCYYMTFFSTGSRSLFLKSIRRVALLQSPAKGNRKMAIFFHAYRVIPSSPRAANLQSRQSTI